jgi:hypothetical protein
MMRACAATFVVLFAVTAPAQDKKEDKIGKDKAPTVLKKALAEVQKKKSAAIVEVGGALRRSPETAAGEVRGRLRKDFAAVKGAAEIYARGSTYLVQHGRPLRSADGARGPGRVRRPGLQESVADPG